MTAAGSCCIEGSGYTTAAFLVLSYSLELDVGARPMQQNHSCQSVTWQLIVCQIIADLTFKQVKRVGRTNPDSYYL